MGLLLSAAGALAAGKLPADPMRPPESGSAAGDSLTGTDKGKGTREAYTLTAIRIGERQHRATINGRSVTVGEKVDGARVVAIEAQSVTLLRNGKKQRIALLPLSVKQKVEAR